MIRLSIISALYLLIASSSPQESSHFPTILDERDGQSYTYVEIENLFWLRENMRYQTPTSMTIPDTLFTNNACGAFYLVDDAFSACPNGWRLPTEKEVKALIKLQKKKQVDILDTLNVKLCGRIDGKKIGRVGMQTTFWIDAPLEEGNIMHWHIFGNEQELHNHNVVEAERQFPVRCVCEIEN